MDIDDFYSEMAYSPDTEVTYGYFFKYFQSWLDETGYNLARLTPKKYREYQATHPNWKSPTHYHSLSDYKRALSIKGTYVLEVRYLISSHPCSWDH